jgi:uncharacterized protein
MKILLSTVKEQSREFHLESPLVLESLKGRAGPGTVSLDVRVQPAGERWYLAGTVSARFPFVCDRCGEGYDGELEGDLTLVVLAKATPGLDPEESEEIVVLPPGSQEIDLADKVREALLLDLPIRLLCREDCRGLCPSCGANLNAGDCGCDAAADPRWSALRDLKKMMAADAEGPDPESGADESEE